VQSDKNITKNMDSASDSDIEYVPNSCDSDSDSSFDLDLQSEVCTTTRK